MAVIHIPEAEAARDFAGVLARVRDGAEVVIESNNRPVAVIKSPEMPRRTISESIAIGEAYEKKLGYAPVMDEDFAADLEEIIRNRKPAESIGVGLILSDQSSIPAFSSKRNAAAHLPRIFCGKFGLIAETATPASQP